MNAPPRLFGIHGPSGSGKTTLIEHLVPLLRARGLRTGTIKHVTHAPSLDAPGKDSHRHAVAGAACVAVVGAGTGAMFVHVDEPDDPWPWIALVGGRVDVVLVEGYRRLPMASVALTSGLGEPSFAAVSRALVDSTPARWALRRSSDAVWPALFPEPMLVRLVDCILGVGPPRLASKGREAEWRRARLCADRARTGHLRRRQVGFT